MALLRLSPIYCPGGQERKKEEELALPAPTGYTGNMKTELWAIVTVGIALAGLSVTGNQRLTTQIEQLDVRLTAQMEQMDQRLTAQMEQMDQRLTAQIEQLDVRVRALETQTARIEGRLIPSLSARADPPAQ